MDQIPDSNFTPIQPPERKTPSKNITKVKFIDELLSKEWLTSYFSVNKDKN